jgi:DNA modification methylase
MLRPIENNSKAGDAVYDPFVGSFTTGIACEMTGRKCLAMPRSEFELTKNSASAGVK